MSQKIKELRSMTDEQFVELHDKVAEYTQVGTRYYLDEPQRRDMEKSTAVMLTLTKKITFMTLVMTVATLINTALVVISLFAPR